MKGSLMMWAFITTLWAVLDFSRSKTTTGPHCIEDCIDKADGRHQSCRGCDVYAECKDGFFRDSIPCGKVEGKAAYWNHDGNRCTPWKNRMCNLKEVEISGAVYIRWGRRSCPITAKLLYIGYAGGSHYAEKGGGSNYICLPEKPHWKRFSGKAHTAAAYVHGAEYQYEYSTTKVDGHLQEDVPCVVCMVMGRFSHMMIPGSDLCPADWTREYTGYLSAERYNHHRSEFVCLDDDPEASVAGRVNQNGVLFFPVQSRCGSLPCPPYANFRELACAVCTH